MSSAINPTDKESLAVFKLLFDFGQEHSYFQRIRISHFWTEKVNILIQLLQLFSFVFACNYYSWPLRWQGMYKSSYISLVAGDLGTLYYEDLYSDSSLRLLYTGGWIILAFIFAIFYLIARFLLHCSVLLRVEFQRIFFKIVHFMYLPFALGLIPVALCQYDNCTADAQQIIVSLLVLVVLIGFLIAYPVYLIRHIRKQVTSTEDEAYDEFIRLKEIEFLLGVSHSWLTEKLYLFSSYRSSWLRIYHRPLYYAFVLELVIVHGAINKNNAAKLLTLLIISGAYAVYVTLLPPYRCLSSSYLHAFCLWLVTANLFIGYLKAAGYDSQTMVDANLVNIIIAINVVGLVLIVLMLIVFFVFRLSWDVGIDQVKQLAVGYRYLLNDLRNAQKMILTLKSFNTFAFVKAGPIEKMEKILIDHYELLSEENHPLQYTAIEQLDILAFLREQVNNESLFKKPYPNLERDYGLLVKVVNRRWREQILLSPVKRKILLKIGVLKLFLGNRETNPFNSGEDQNFMEKGKKKNISDSDLNKFYQEFEDFESSREFMSDTKKGPRDEEIFEIDERD